MTKNPRTAQSRMQHYDDEKLASRTYGDDDTPWPGPHEEEPQMGTRPLNEEADQCVHQAQSEPEAPWLGLLCNETKSCTNAAKRRLQLEVKRDPVRMKGCLSHPSET